MGLVDDAFDRYAGALARGHRRRDRTWPGRRGRPRSFVPLERTPWPRVAAAGVVVLIAAVGAMALGLLGFLALAFRDDTLGFGLLAVFGPFALGGVVALGQVIVGLSALAVRAWRRDGRARAELGLVGLAALLVLVPAYLGSGWSPVLVGALPAASLVGLALWPTPWRRASAGGGPVATAPIRWVPDADPST